MSDPVERLKHLDAAPGSVEADGIALLRARDPYVPPAARKARVRAALATRWNGGAVPAWRRRVAFAAIFFFAGAAGSGVSFGRQWVGERYRRLVAWVTTATTSAPEAPAAVRVAPAAPVEAPAAPVDEPAPAREHVRLAHVEARSARHAGRAIPVVDDEPTLVATAMRALRRDHDAELAAGLLDDYLRRWPNGALFEEALALAIEAANDRGDARARTFAMEYVRRFPNGRFGEAARRTLARPAP